MVTNLGVPACAALNANNVYVQGVTYAIQKLGSLSNLALYLDIGHSGCAGFITRHTSRDTHSDLTAAFGSTDVCSANTMCPRHRAMA